MITEDGLISIGFKKDGDKCFTKQFKDLEMQVTIYGFVWLCCTTNESSDGLGIGRFETIEKIDNLQKTIENRL